MQENSRKRKRVEEWEEEEESCRLIPPDDSPGFRFQPTDQDLLSYFLYNKVTTTKSLLSFTGDTDTEFVKDYDLYGTTEPWHIWDMFGGTRLEEKSRGKVGDLDLYFFTKLKKVNPKGSNFIRKMGSGLWQGETKNLC